MAAEAGTEAADYPNSVSSQALGMDEAAQAVQNAGVTAQWDDETKQNYAKWEADGKYLQDLAGRYAVIGRKDDSNPTERTGRSCRVESWKRK